MAAEYDVVDRWVGHFTSKRAIRSCLKEIDSCDALARKR